MSGVTITPQWDCGNGSSLTSHWPGDPLGPGGPAGPGMPSLPSFPGSPGSLRLEQVLAALSQMVLKAHSSSSSKRVVDMLRALEIQNWLECYCSLSVHMSYLYLSHSHGNNEMV